MNRLLVHRRDCAPDGTLRLSGRRAVHIRDVLHAAPGDEIRAGFLGEGGAVATVLGFEGDECLLRLRDDPDAALLDKVRALAAAEGLFVWTPPRESQPDAETRCEP